MTVAVGVVDDRLGTPLELDWFEEEVTTTVAGTTVADDVVEELLATLLVVIIVGVPVAMVSTSEVFCCSCFRSNVFSGLGGLFFLRFLG